MAVETTCPFCRNALSGRPVKCPFCGMSVPQPLRAQAAAAQEEERRRKQADTARRAAERAQQVQAKEAKRQYQLQGDGWTVFRVSEHTDPEDAAVAIATAVRGGV